MIQEPVSIQEHSAGWIVQTRISFIISITATSMGIIFLPVDIWTKGFIGMGLAFSIGSTISLTKTQRDIYEGKKLIIKERN
jgi:hypothetical protein